MAYNRLVRKLTVENLWIYILNILQRGPTHAYGIKKTLKSDFGISPATITIYVVLYKMQREGLIRHISTKGGVFKKVNRKYYEITEKGRDLYRQGVLFIDNMLTTLRYRK